MDGAILSILVGAGIWGGQRIWGAGPATWILSMFTGAVITGLFQTLGLYEISPILQLSMPAALLMGLWTGLLLAWSQQKSWFVQGPLRFSATLVLAVIHGSGCAGILWLLPEFTGNAEILTPGFGRWAPVLGLISFVTLFGYAFPARRFRFSDRENTKHGPQDQV